MAPKKKKETPVVPKKDPALEIAAQLEKEQLRACVSVVVGKSSDEEDLIETLKLALQESQQKQFALVSWENTLAQIHKLGNRRTKKPKDVPMYYEILEPAKALLDAGKEIPCELMARIVKFQLLSIKASNLHSEDNREEPKEKETKASETKLKCRGEVDPFIDDEPGDGPQLYAFLLGFHQPQLVGALDAMGIQVPNVIKLCSDYVHISDIKKEVEVEEEEEMLEEDEDEEEEEEEEERERMCVPRDEKCTVPLVSEQQLFWSGVGALLDSAPPGSRLRYVARLSYTVPNAPKSLNRQEHKAMLELGTSIFDGVARLIHNCMGWRKQYQHYRDSVKLTDIPTVVGMLVKTDHCPVVPVEIVPLLPASVQVKPSTAKKTVQKPSKQNIQPATLTTDADMRRYDNVLQLVPPEACSVPITPQGTLEKVVASEKQTEATRSYVGPGLDYGLACHLLDSYLPLARSEEQRMQMVHSLLTRVHNEQDKKNILMEFGEEDSLQAAETKLGQSQGSDPAEVKLPMMYLSTKESWDMLVHTDVDFRNYMAHEADFMSDWTRAKEAEQEAGKQTHLEPNTVPPVDDREDALPAEESCNGFLGYLMDGTPVRVSGWHQHLFPSDGGHITVERVCYAQGPNLTKVDLRKDGHHFHTHISHVVKATPSEDAQEVIQGSFSAVLHNGIRLFFSHQGATGQVAVSPQSEESIDTGSEATAPCTFTGLSLYVPNGLLLQIFLEDADTQAGAGHVERSARPYSPATGGETDKSKLDPIERSVCVRQSFPLLTERVLGKLQDKALAKEVSRVITVSGAVVKHMRDCSTEVLFADGGVSVSSDTGPVGVSYSEPEGGNTTATDKTTDSPTPERVFWNVTTPSGERFCTIANTNSSTPLTPLLTHQTTDCMTPTVLRYREDFVTIAEEPNGDVAVEHTDRTQITGKTLKDPTIGKRFLVEREGCAAVAMYPDRGSAHVFLADGTVVTANSRGAFQVILASGGRLQIQPDGMCVYSSENTGSPGATSETPGRQPCCYFMSHTHKVACTVTDPDGNLFQVMQNGKVSTQMPNPAGRFLGLFDGAKSDKDVDRVKKAHRPRLFLVHEDGSGTELSSSNPTMKLLYQDGNRPNTHMMKESLPEAQGEFGITVLLKPIHRSVWSHWSHGKKKCIIPAKLRDRDMDDFVFVEAKKLGPPVGKHVVAGRTLFGRTPPPPPPPPRRALDILLDAIELREQ